MNATLVFKGREGSGLMVASLVAEDGTKLASKGFRNSDGTQATAQEIETIDHLIAYVEKNPGTVVL